MCYTYDELSRVTERTARRISDDFVLPTENFVYDAAGNIYGGDADTAFGYDVNNRLTSFNGNSVNYDADGNMLSNGVSNFTYDSANRLVSADGHTYTYSAEDIRIRNLCETEDTTYTYDTNCKLNKLLCKTTNGVTTKYIYGLGLIGEEVNNTFKTYHFDYRGSTVAITNVNGTVTDTFTYNTYGKLTNRTGNSDVIFCYNGRDGVITEDNGLVYMRARYYSPDMRRFINADIIPGQISNAVTLNRYTYANGNPVSNVDPFGLSAERDRGSYNYRVRAERNTGIIVECSQEEPDWNNFGEYLCDQLSGAAWWVVDTVLNWSDRFGKDTTAIRNDFEKFDLNNTDENVVLESNYFSAYKGQLVIREDWSFADGRSASFGIMFLYSNEDNVDTVRHEYGHYIQLQKLGIMRYSLYVAIPSVNAGDVPYALYYSLPFERSADILGKVEREGYVYTDEGKGESFIEDTIEADERRKRMIVTKFKKRLPFLNKKRIVDVLIKKHNLLEGIGEIEK